MIGAVWLALALACRTDDGGADADADTDTDSDSDSDSDTDTDTDPPAWNLDASCVVSATNGLRATCTAAFDRPLTLEVTLTVGSDPPVVFTADGPATAPELVIWGLAREAECRWTATAVEDRALLAGGTIAAGPIAADLTAMEVVVDAPGPHGDEAVLLNYGCLTFEESLAILDRDGRIRWYQEASDAPVTPSPLSFRSLNVSPEGDILALLERDHAIRWRLDGTVAFLVNRFEAFQVPVHHEITRQNGLTYVLFAEEVDVAGEPFVTDGFFVFDDAGTLLAEWHMAEHLAVVAGGSAGGGYWNDVFPDALDWSHTNAVAVDGDLNVTLSLRYQDALVRVIGDPAALDFGRVVWTVAGDASSTVPTTVPYTSSAGIADLGFQEQHHVVASGPGELTLWDNGEGVGAVSRAVRFAADDAGLDLIEEWPVGAFCPGQGSATVLPTGNVLVDCAPADTIAEVTPTGETVWSARLSCDMGLMLRPLYRGLPIDLFPGSP